MPLAFFFYTWETAGRILSVSSFSLPLFQLDVRVPRLLFVAVNLAGIAVALYKLAMMGLLPVTSADWLSYLPLKAPIEYSAPALAL